MILDNCPYLIAVLLTAGLHTAWSSIPFTIHQQFSLLVSTRSSAAVTIIKLHTFALLLLVFSLSFKTTSAISLFTSQESHTYNFDDLPTPHNGLGPINTYKHLTFTGFSVLTPHAPNLPYIHPSDLNCATSSPNALLGSRYGGSQQLQSSISINAAVGATKSRQLDNIPTTFNLYSLSIKPLAMPIDSVSDPVIANLTIRGWLASAPTRAADQQLVFGVKWSSGYAEPLRVDFRSYQFSKLRWEGLDRLDFAVEYGPGRLDWEFCLDDLVVSFGRG